MADNEREGMKKCTKCGEWKPATLEYFHRDKTIKGGLRAQCKVCLGYQVREYNKKNKEKLADRKSEYMREYREKNKEKLAEQQRERRKKNKEKISEYGREYYQKNKDRRREYNLEYREKNKDREREYNREYYQKNKDQALEYAREYRQSPVGKLVQSVEYLRQKTGATIYVRDMTEEQKETLANQYVAVRTLEKTEKELLAASGKKRCTRCDRILDYEMFYKSEGRYMAACKACFNEWVRKKYHKNKERELERCREYRQKNKDKIAERKRQARQKNKKALDKIKSIPDNGV